MRQRILLLFACALFTLTLQAGARADNALRLGETVLDWQAIAPHVTALRDPGQKLGIDDVRDAGFAALPEGHADFGYTTDAIWLRLTLVNETDNPDWRLRVRENFFQIFEVHAETGGSLARLEAQDPGSVFADRAIPYPELVTGLTLPPSEPTTLFIRYHSGGSSEITFQIMTARDFDAWASRKTAKNFIYYGMMLFLVSVAVVAAVATRRGIFAAYALYAGFGLLFVMHADGNAFKYLWPNAPGLNANASAYLGGGLVIFGANFAREFLQTYVYHKVLEKLLLGAMLLAGGMLLSMLVLDTQMIKKYLVLTAFGATLLFAVSGAVAARTRFREVRFYVIAWGGAVISSAIMTMRHWLGIDISEEAQFDSMRIVLVLDAALMGMAILDRINQLRRSQQEALEVSLVEAQNSLALTRRLEELESRYRLLETVAQSRAKSLADTAHDLRQPLHALRMNLHRLMRREDAGVGLREVEDAFDYLEGLVASGLEQFDRDAPDEDAPLAVGEVLQAVADMFQADAAERGIALRHVASSATTTVPALALMRMVANLVSNAVKYTETGRVLIGVRRVQGAARIEVHDTGSGMSADEFARATERRVRLDSTKSHEGAGLGLAIVGQLADQHRVSFGHRPAPGGGSCLFLSLP